MIPRTFIKFDWKMKDVLREIERMTSNLDTVSPLAIDEYGEILVDAIRSYTPRKTGEAQASIGKYEAGLIDGDADPIAHVRAKQNAIYKMRRIRSDTWELVVGSESDVVVWLNYGTRKMKANYMFERGQVAAAPYLTPLVRKAIDASVRPSGWITAGRWNKIHARTTFNPGVGGGKLLDGRRTRIRISAA